LPGADDHLPGAIAGDVVHAPRLVPARGNAHVPGVQDGAARTLPGGELHRLQAGAGDDVPEGLLSNVPDGARGSLPYGVSLPDGVRAARVRSPRAVHDVPDGDAGAL